MTTPFQDDKPSPFELIHRMADRLEAHSKGDKPDMRAAIAECRSLLQDTDVSTRICLQRILRMFYGEASNLNYDIAANGEAEVIRRGCGDGGVVFDVGANRGDWSKAVLGVRPFAEIHCFEIVGETADALAERFANTANVHVNRCGLSDEQGLVTVHAYAGRSELASMYPVHQSRESRKIECRTTTGDLYCTQKRIERIRLLKVDCEGAELKVLRGFTSMLRKRRIDLIQFEYGKGNVISRVLLLDIFKFLERHGFRIGRIFPTGVAFKGYEYEDEDFIGPNYLACRKDLHELQPWLASFGKTSDPHPSTRTECRNDA